MNLDKLKDFFNNHGLHELPTGAAALIGIVVLVLIFKAKKSMAKVILLLIAIGLFAGAYWWHNQK
jgi:hypothetical protein